MSQGTTGAAGETSIPLFFIRYPNRKYTNTKKFTVNGTSSYTYVFVGILPLGQFSDSPLCSCICCRLNLKSKSSNNYKLRRALNVFGIKTIS